MAATIRCESCKKWSHCVRCHPQPHLDGVKVSEGCRSCRRKYDTSQKDLAESYLDLAEQKGDNRKQKADLTFLKLNALDCEQSNSIVISKGDVKILVESEAYEPVPMHAHRFILADKSQVLSKMFQTDMLEKETGVIRISDTSPPVMRALIYFCYTAEIVFTEEVSPEEVLITAHKYGIDRLQAVCEEELTKRLNKDSLFSMLQLAKKLEAKVLHEAASKYLIENFDSAFPVVFKDLFSYHVRVTI